MTDIAFTSLAFRPQYVEQQKRLKESILAIYPDAPLFFWTDSYPAGCPDFWQSMYGFKPHLVRQCFQAGYKKIAFFDPAVILLQPLNYYDTIVRDYGVIAASDDQTLDKCTSDKCLQYNSLERSEVANMRLVGGSFYYFDFNTRLCHEIFNKWIDMEKAGIFGDQDTQSKGLDQQHRNDETCMSLALYLSGSKPTPYDIARYDKVSDPIMRKCHFK